MVIILSLTFLNLSPPMSSPPSITLMSLSASFWSFWIPKGGSCWRTSSSCEMFISWMIPWLPGFFSWILVIRFLEIHVYSHSFLRAAVVWHIFFSALYLAIMLLTFDSFLITAWMMSFYEIARYTGGSPLACALCFCHDVVRRIDTLSKNW